MDWVTLKPAIVSLLSKLAAEDFEDPLDEGVVSWFGAQQDFISTETQAGIYIRVLYHDKRGRPRKDFIPVTVNGAPKLRQRFTRQEKVTLQVQATSLEHTDTNCGQAWIDRITDRLYGHYATKTLKALGLSVIEVRPTLNVSVKSPLDGTLGIDNREVSAVSADIVMQAVNIVYGETVDVIEHVKISGTIQGAATGELPVPEFEV